MAARPGCGDRTDLGDRRQDRPGLYPELAGEASGGKSSSRPDILDRASLGILQAGLFAWVFLPESQVIGAVLVHAHWYTRFSAGIDSDYPGYRAG
jgi:hypothetical protein